MMVLWKDIARLGSLINWAIISIIIAIGNQHFIVMQGWGVTS